MEESSEREQLPFRDCDKIPLVISKDLPNQEEEKKNFNL